MAASRFFAVGPFDGDLLPLSPQDLHHAVTVLRLAPGDELTLVSEDRVARRLRLTEVSKTALRGELIDSSQRPWLPSVTLVTALAKGDKTDLAVEKAVELGAEGIVLLETERSQVRLDAARRPKRVDRLARIAESAARQSDRFEVPPVAGPVTVSEFASSVEGFARVLVAWEEHAVGGIDAAVADVAADGRVAVVVGPEGGLTPAEVGVLTDAGAVAVTLGPGILRTETAAIVATALTLAAMGGMGFRGDR